MHLYRPLLFLPEEVMTLRGPAPFCSRLRNVSALSTWTATSLRLLFESGYRGEIEFDPVGQTVSSMGYEELLASIRQYVDDFQNDINVIGSNACRSAYPLPMAGAFPR